MISFDLQVSPKTLRTHTYSISRSSNLYMFLKNEYPNLKGEYDHLLIIKKPKRIFRRDFSVKIPIGTLQHSYFKTEYNSLMEDYEHNIIVPEDEQNTGRRR